MKSDDVLNSELVDLRVGDDAPHDGHDASERPLVTVVLAQLQQVLPGALGVEHDLHTRNQRDSVGRIGHLMVSVVAVPASGQQARQGELRNVEAPLREKSRLAASRKRVANEPDDDMAVIVAREVYNPGHRKLRVGGTK